MSDSAPAWSMLPVETYDAICRIARNEDVSVSALIRLIIEEYRTARLDAEMMAAQVNISEQIIRSGAQMAAWLRVYLKRSDRDLDVADEALKIMSNPPERKKPPMFKDYKTYEQYLIDEGFVEVKDILPL
jgi:hypothetical protein